MNTGARWILYLVIAVTCIVILWAVWYFGIRGKIFPEGGYLDRGAKAIDKASLCATTQVPAGYGRAVWTMAGNCLTCPNGSVLNPAATPNPDDPKKCYNPLPICTKHFPAQTINGTKYKDAFPDMLAGVSTCFACPEGSTKDPSIGPNQPNACRYKCPDIDNIFGTLTIDGLPHSNWVDDVFSTNCLACPDGWQYDAGRTEDNRCIKLEGTCRDKYGGNAFEDWNSGNCYTCPAGYERTLAGINSDEACVFKTPNNNDQSIYSINGNWYYCPTGYSKDSAISDANNRPCGPTGALWPKYDKRRDGIYIPAGKFEPIKYLGPQIEKRPRTKKDFGAKPYIHSLYSPAKVIEVREPQ